MNNYTPYHIHTMLSNGITNVDSITDFHDYVDRAKELGMKAFCFSEHGSIFAWLKKKEYIEECGMKYIHGIEAYLTEDNEYSDNKNRDNYHCILIAKNYDGVKELNSLVSKSFNRSDYHYYYYPRITFDELFGTSDNIIVTSACLGGALFSGSPITKEKFLTFLIQNKHRCFLEIQHHNCKDQISYNKTLYELHKKYNIPLIAGTDSHAINQIHMDGRAILQKGKNVHFDSEDEWDLSFKSYEELIAAYKKQNSLPMFVVLQAIENTNIMADMVEEFKIDYNAKYPKLYADSEKVFKEKIQDGIKWRGIEKYPNYQEYLDRIQYEFEVYKHNGAIDFMLLEENYKSEMRRRNIKFGYSRGSVSGSIIAYLLGITEIDSIKYNLNFERFMNKERVSLADVDTDWLSEDRKAVKDYLYGKKGLYCCDIVTFNTIALKGAIKDICRGFYYDNIDHLPKAVLEKVKAWDKKESELAKEVGNGYETKPYPEELQSEIRKYSIHKEVPIEYLKFSEDVIKLAELDEDAARNKYPELFKYVDLVNGVVVSVGNHPAGCVVSPFPVDEWFGTFTTSSDEYPISMLNMKEIDKLNFVKLDILGLDNIGLIYKTCDAAGIPFATPDNIPADDEAVWQSIKEDTTMIFQWESQSATTYLRQLLSDETIKKIREKNPKASYMDLLSIGNGAIRPAGETYRDELAQGIYRDNGNDALNEFLAYTLGYLVYQEQIIEFLHSFCGYTMGEADVVRRGFAKKTGTEKFIPKIKEGFNKTMAEKYGVTTEESEKIIVNFLQVIEDASNYLFSKNHADPYSWIGYICGYLRYYYPLEFITTALNIFESKEEKTLAIINYAKKRGIKIRPIKFRHSTAKYSFDKDTNSIFKGISSIKYMNDNIANEMYAIKDEHFETFIDLLISLKEKTSVNARQLAILIDLDFFEEFGESNKLMYLAKLFDEIYGKKQIKKDKVNKLELPFELFKDFKETPTMFTMIDSKSLLKNIEVATTHITPRNLSEKIIAQIKHLGYIDIMDDRYSGMAAVVGIDKKFSPKLKMYSLKNGTTIDCKIDKRTFNKIPLKNGDIVSILGTKKKPKVRKNTDGEWENVPGTNELWITNYRKSEML